jgi:hypothetical protein
MIFTQGLLWLHLVSVSDLYTSCLTEYLLPDYARSPWFRTLCKETGIAACPVQLTTSVVLATPVGST